MMRKIKCNECGKELFETSLSDGAAGAEAQGRGYVFKMPILYGVEGCYFFCGKECATEWFDKHVPKDPAANALIKAAKDKAPEVAADIAKKMVRLQKILIHKNKC